MRDPLPEDWKRVKRYASWMREVCVDNSPALGEDTFRELPLNSPAGGWFPALRGLSWHITESNLPYVDLFFSPYLSEVSIFPPQSWSSSRVMRTVASTISGLPTTPLQSLWVSYTTPWVDLTESLSSVVLRCGSSLTEFTSSIPLSDMAMNHLVHLPNLRSCRVEGPPPSYSALPTPPIFPSLMGFMLGRGATRGWLSLFRRLEDSVSSTQCVTPLSRMKESLWSLNREESTDLTVDVSLTSTIRMFHNLTYLAVRVGCHDEDNTGQCAFELNNDDVTKFAMTLSQLEILILGNPCSKNTCTTTVACLLPISVYCVRLQELRIHFNTMNIVDDLKNISENPIFEELRCSLSNLGARRTPLTVDPPGLEAVVNGMADIFPTLEHCDRLVYNPDWEEFFERMVERQKTRTPPAHHW